MNDWRAEATASSMERTSHCPAWVMLAKDLPPEPDKPYATQGTDLHLDTMRAMECGTPLEKIKDKDVCFCVREMRNTIPEGSEIFLEQRLPFCGTSGGIDCYALHRPSSSAYLFDHKFGMGIRVIAKDNPQVASYMVAIRKAHRWVKVIHAKVIQPRITGEDFHDMPSVTDWSLRYQSIDAWERRINGWLDEVEIGTRMATGEGCRFCPVRPTCALHAGHAADVVSRLDLPTVTDSNLPVDISRLAAMLEKEEQVVSWFKKLREFLEVCALQGVEIPGFELRKKKAHRKWHEMMEPEEIAKRLVTAGIPKKKVWTTPELISPAQAEKLAKDDIGLLWQKPEGGLALRPIK